MQRDTEAPAWARDATRTVNVSDIWLEATDPRGEREDECIAYLQRYDADGMDEYHCACLVTAFELVGISITDASHTIYRNREWAERVLGNAAIWAIERHEMEAVQ